MTRVPWYSLHPVCCILWTKICASSPSNVDKICMQIFFKWECLNLINWCRFVCASTVGISKSPLWWKSYGPISYCVFVHFSEATTSAQWHRKQKQTQQESGLRHYLAGISVSSWGLNAFSRVHRPQNCQLQPWNRISRWPYQKEHMIMYCIIIILLFESHLDTKQYQAHFQGPKARTDIVTCKNH